MDANDKLEEIRSLIDAAATKGKPAAERFAAAEQLLRTFREFDAELCDSADLPDDWAGDDDDGPDPFNVDTAAPDPFREFDRVCRQ